MKFLFVLQYPGYLRYFDSVLRLLVERGHTVVVSYNDLEKQSEGGEALAGLPIETLQVPRRHSAWQIVGRELRGTMDYVRYLDPRFADAPYLRDRMRKALPPISAFLGRYDTLSARTTSRMLGFLYTCERAIPSSGSLRHFLEKVKPDAVIVSPLVMDRSPQVDVIKSAKALGIPNALSVASWDHLTTKGLIRVAPDLVALWNHHQREEAETLHRISPDRIVVTGAQPFDRWFGREPGRNREQFCALVGLRSDRPFVLFVGSTASISEPSAEIEFVRQWVARVRAELAKESHEVGVLIRPHPYNFAHWTNADLGDLENVAVFPRTGSNPVDDADRMDYFDSMFHSAAVVGINTSAMIESAIVGRTVHTILDPAFAATQQGTLHFRYLLPANGGFLRVANSLDEHVAQLVETIRDPSAGRPALDAFVRAFVRPHGLHVPATPLLADALERLARSPRAREAPMSALLYPLRAMLFLSGCAVAYRDPATLRRRLAMRMNHWRKDRAKRQRKRPRPTRV